MSDTAKAPERIWAISDRRRHWTDEKPAGPSECHSIEYIRKDVSDALVAAAREEALRPVDVSDKTKTTYFDSVLAIEAEMKLHKGKE